MTQINLFHIPINGTLCTIQKQQYNNKRIALLAIDEKDGRPYARLTVNIPQADVQPDEVLLNTNTCTWDLIMDLQKANIIGPDCIAWEKSGYVTYPKFKLLI